MTRKYILIVDDDPDLLFLAAHGVKSLGPEHQVVTAPNGISALNQAQNQTFDLIITDYMMPEMSGLELMEQVRQISPQTQFILMTAHHDSGGIRNKIETKELAGFVGKPFTLSDLLEEVKGVISQLDSVLETPLSNTPIQKGAIEEQLKNLHRQTGARSVILINADGSPMAMVGVTDPSRVARLASFVSSNFLAIMELASLFGDKDSAFSSSYYEGNNYNIYAYNINGEFFLAVLFDVGGKPGTVWFYTKQVAATLVPILPTTKKSLLTHKDSLTLAKDFDDMFGDVEPNDA